MDQAQAVTANHKLELKQLQHLCNHQTNSCVCLIPPGRANHWSAIIGASHSKNYVLWEYGGYASDGVKQVAELGSPVKMEEEIRQKVSFSRKRKTKKKKRKIAALALSRLKVSTFLHFLQLCVYRILQDMYTFYELLITFFLF